MAGAEPRGPMAQARAASAVGRAAGPVPEDKGRRPARYCVKLLANSAAIVFVAFLVSLVRSPLRGHTPR